MAPLQADAGASGRSRRKGFRVLLGLASMFLLDGCRTWNDGYGGWDGYTPYYHHRHHQHRRPPPPPPPAPLVVPHFQKPHLPAYRAPHSGQHWQHRHSGEPSWRRGHGAGDGKRHEHRWQNHNRGDDHRRRR